MCEVAYLRKKFFNESFLPLIAHYDVSADDRQDEPQPVAHDSPALLKHREAIAFPSLGEDRGTDIDQTYTAQTERQTDMYECRENTQRS